MTARPAPLLIGLAAMVAASVVHAQSLEDRLRSQLVIVTAQLHDAQTAQATAVAQAATAQKERDALKARLAHSTSELAAARRTPVVDVKAQQQAAERAQATVQASAQDQAKLAALQTDAARAAQELDQTRSERDRAASTLAGAQSSLAICTAKNAEAIGVARDVLAAYHRVGLGQVLARREPLTGLGRVRFEALEQTYGDRLYDSRLDVPPRKPASATPVPTPGPK